ncbi:MAG: N-acetyltransferase [Rhodanobacteraceae bacterium]|nr:MAG: N-acetyltransferase [Rhodanobacteraceae bacterium]
MPSHRSVIRIRRASAADLDALVALEQATFTSDRISRRQWRRHISNANASLRVHGTRGHVDAAALVFYRRHSSHARLYSLAVAADARGAGLGGRLLGAAEAAARAHGCSGMRLEVRVDNATAIALYTRHGYVRIARLPGYYEDGGDGWRFGKALATGAG